MKWIAFFLSLSLSLSLPVSAADPAVAAGGWHSLALHRDGSVRGWGDDSSGALGVGRSLVSQSPLPVSGLTGVVAVAAGGNHTLALKGDGTVWAWGANDNGELGDGSTVSRSLPGRVMGLDNVVQIAAGRFYSVARRNDGTVWTWGSNFAGEQGAEGGHRSLPGMVNGLSGIVEVAAGPYHALARRSDGTVWAWGLNGDGQLGDGTRTESYAGRSTPVRAGALTDVVQVSAGGWHSVARKSDGTVWTWGANDLAQGGSGAPSTPRLAPVQAGVANIVEISAGMYHTLARGANGTIVAWGGSGYGQLGHGVFEESSPPVTLPELTGVTQLAAGFLHSAAVRQDGTLWIWGANSNGQLGDDSPGTRTRPAQLAGLSNVAAVAVGMHHTVALKRDGTVLTWGDDSQGQLGNGVYTFRATPQAVVSLPAVTAVSAGYLHSLALAADGRVFAWGSNGANQLAGDGIGRSAPQPVAGLENVAQISAGAYHSLARLADGTVRAFGSNYRGRLGNGNPDDFGPLSTVRDLAGVRHVSAGGGHSLAAREDGTVWAWGENGEGQLGDGTTLDRFAPVQVAGLADVVEVAAGVSHSLARKRDGSVWAWGRNVEGQLGDGTQVDRTRPVRVASLPAATAIAAGREFSLALSGGNLWTWGVNYTGGIGCPGCDGRSGVLQVPGLGGVAAVSAFQHHVLVLRGDGSVLSWGAGALGQLGDGTLVDREAPVVVLRDGGAGSVAGNDWFLDLDPAAASAIAPENVPVFLLAASASGNDINATVRPRAEDVGAQRSIFVFAMAPESQVQGAAAPGVAKLGFARDARKAETPIGCVLAQLNAAGQMVAVSSANLAAYLTGVLSAQGASVNILNGVPTGNVSGATFFVGYGSSGSSMIGTGINRAAVTIPGSLTCEPAAPQTGWWWNPAEDGRGYSIEKRGNNLFFAAFLYDVSGRSTWHVSSGPVSLDGTLYNGDLLSASGGQTLGGAYPGFPQLRSAGPMTMTFNNAATGTLVWSGGTVPIQRFNIVPNGLTLAPASNIPESGWWWNEQESGRGFFMEWQGNTLDIAGYMYDDAGNPVWYLTVGNQSADGRSFSGNWWSYADGMPLMGPWRPHRQVSNNVAPLAITFTGPDSALMTLPNGRSTALRRHRF